MDVSENSGTPKSSILIGFSIINHPFWGTPIFGNTQIKALINLPSSPVELVTPPPWRLATRWISSMARGRFEGCQGCWKEMDHCWRTSSIGTLVAINEESGRWGKIPSFAVRILIDISFLGAMKIYDIFGFWTFYPSHQYCTSTNLPLHLGQDSTPPLRNDWVAWVSWPTLGWTNGVSFSHCLGYGRKWIWKPR